MVNYAIKILVDNDAPYTYRDVGIDPYILEAEWSVGGKYSETWQRDGNLRITLDNSSDLFSPYNTSSPFYQKLLTKRRIQVTINGVVAWSGFIEKLTPMLDFKKPVTELTATQGVTNIKDIRLVYPFYQAKNGNELVAALIADNPYISFDTSVFTLDYSLLGENLTEDYAANVTNEVPADTIYAYASDTWDSSTNLYEALDNIAKAEQCLIFLDENNRLSIVPFYYTKLAAIADSINIDNEAVKANFSIPNDIVNEAVVSYYERVVVTDTVVTKTQVSLVSGETYTWRVDKLDTEQKKIVLSDIVATVGGSYVGSFVNLGEEIQVTATATGTYDVTLQATVVKIGKQQEATAQLQQSIDVYRSVFSNDYNYKLIQTESAALSLGHLITVRNGLPYSYVESIDFVNKTMHYMGEVLLISSAKLDAPTRHLITGVHHTVRNDYLQSTYYMIGADAFKVFVLDSSLLDGGDVII